MRIILLFLCSISLLVTSCVSTSVVAVHDKTFKGKPIKRVMVLGVSPDLERRNEWENTFVDVLSDYQTQCVRGLDLIPPLREYSNAEIYDVLSDASVDVVLAVALTDFWTEYFQGPDQFRTETKITLSPLFNSATSTSRTTRTPGLEFKKHGARFDVRLLRFNVDSSVSVLWRANSTSKGNAFASGLTVILSNATELCEQLWKDGFLADYNAMSKASVRSDQPIISKGTGGRLKFNNYGRLTVFGGTEWQQKLGYFNVSKSEWLITDSLGDYGRKAKETIWDSLGPYASESSDCSACNIFASKPPRIETDDGQIVGYMSLNPNFSNVITDKDLVEWLLFHVCRRVVGTSGSDQSH